MAINHPIQSSDQLRKPPSQGGPRRVMPENQQIQRQLANQNRRQKSNSPIKKAIKRRLIKKFAPYLIAGGSTGIGLAFGLSDFLF